jgi:hypothetical protein
MLPPVFQKEALIQLKRQCKPRTATLVCGDTDEATVGVHDLPGLHQNHTWNSSPSVLIHPL